MQLEGKRVVLTGGAGGLGQLVTRGLLAEGAKLLVVDRAPRLPFDAEAEYVRGDLSSMEGISAIAARLAEATPDILVNLAGRQHFGACESQTDSDTYFDYMVNLVAPVLLSKAVLPAMKHRGSGHIVNVGSVLGAIGYPHFAVYSSTKGGLKIFSEALRRELAAAPIAVTYIAPRATRTGLSTLAVQRYAELTGMQMDAPETTAGLIIRAIRRRSKDITIGTAEGLFVRLNVLCPRLMDSAIVKNDRKAIVLFTSQLSETE